MGVSLVFLLVVFVASSAFSQQETQTIETQGYGVIISSDLANARDRAIDDALRKAVEQAVGTMVTSDTEVQNFQLKKDEILSQTAGFVQRYEVARGWKEDASTYVVTVRAVVKIGNLKEDLQAKGILMERIGKPRIMILMRERNMTDRWDQVSVDLNISETTLINAFREESRKFNFVDQAAVKANLDRSQARSAFAGGAGEAAAIGRSFGADVMIVGEAYSNAVQVPMLGSMISCQATVGAKMIWADNGQIFGTDVAQGKHPHIDQVAGGVLAIQKASQALSEKLIPEVWADWREKVMSGRQLSMVVKNATFSQLRAFERTMKLVVGGVQKLNRRSFDSGVAIYDVTSKFDANRVAEELDGKDMEGFKVQVLSVTANSLEISLSE